MARLDSSTILQIDATIITGLLILVTLSSFSINSVIAKSVSVEDEIANKKIEQSAYIAIKNELKSKLSNLNQTETQIHIQTQLVDNDVNLIRVNTELMGLQAKSEQWINTQNSTGAIWIIIGFRYAIFLMILPFVASATSEALVSTIPKFSQDDKASKLGKWLMITGFVALLIGLSWIFSRPFTV